mgnify:FL=1
MKEPAMHTKLNVHNFCLNKALLGEADITGVWDSELGGVRLMQKLRKKVFRPLMSPDTYLRK